MIFLGYFLIFILHQSQWKESWEYISVFDDQNRSESSITVNQINSESYIILESIQIIIDWIYKKEFDLDNHMIKDTDNIIYKHLNHFMKILNLMNEWDISLLKKNMKNHILSRMNLFIYIEIIHEVREIINQCNINELKKYHRKFERLNKMMMNRIQILENIITVSSVFIFN